jgi:phage tail sheath gpL-like
VTITFNSIPVNLRVPGVYVEIDSSQAVTDLSQMPTRIMLLGQMLATGTATPLVPVLITSGAQAIGLFGRGSMLARMATMLLGANSFTETWACPTLDLAAGSAATGAITVTTAPTAAGTLYLYIGGQPVSVGITAGMTAAQVAGAIATAIQALPDLPVTAANPAAGAPAVVPLTALHKGLAGNGIDLRISYYAEPIPAGLGLTLTALTGGAGNPLVQPLLSALGEVWYSDIVTPWTDAASLTAIETWLVANFGPLVQHDGHCWGVITGTAGQVQTIGQNINYPFLTLMASQNSPTPPWEFAAVLAGIAAYYLAIDPARPLQTLTLTGVLAPAVADRFLFATRNTLLYSGIATFKVAADGTVQIERAITTYTTAATGAADPSFLDVEVLRTLAYLRYDVRTLIALKYPRAKLANDGTTAGATVNAVATADQTVSTVVVTPKVMRAELLARFQLWLTAGLVQNPAAFAANLQVARNAGDPDRLDCLIPPEVIAQLRVVAAEIQFSL